VLTLTAITLEDMSIGAVRIPRFVTVAAEQTWKMGAGTFGGGEVLMQASTAAFLSCDFGTTWSCIKCSELECDSRPWTGY